MSSVPKSSWLIPRPDNADVVEYGLNIALFAAALGSRSSGLQSKPGKISRRQDLQPSVPEEH